MSRSHDGPISTRERLSDTLTDLPTAPLPPPKRVRVSTLQDAETRRLREQELDLAVERTQLRRRPALQLGVQLRREPQEEGLAFPFPLQLGRFPAVFAVVQVARRLRCRASPC